MKRINLNMSDELIEKIDAYAKELGINRTSAISVLCATQLKQNETIDVIRKASEIVDKSE